MATGKETVAYILDQLTPLPVRARAMFGEYGLYCGEKLVGLICDDTLFVKSTPAAAAFLDAGPRAPPNPGAKDSYAVPRDRLDDREWLQSVVAQTAEQLPSPKPKKRKSRGGGGGGGGFE